MTYKTIALIQRDPIMRDRISPCICVEAIAFPPEQWAADHAWQLAAQPGWADAWQKAEATHGPEGYEPGADETIITDDMILTAVRNITETTT